MVMGEPASLRVDLRRGGRWTSLRVAGREWLWHRDEPLRERAAAGDPFADAGGIEECVPTVRGQPDHGDAWCRAWSDLGAGSAEVDCGDFALYRRVVAEPDLVTARYRLTARPGYRFIWAAHALLDVSPEAELQLPDNPALRLYPEAAPLLGRPWPSGSAFVTERWPGPPGLPLNWLGPDDGTAVGAIAVNCRDAIVRDGADSLRLRLAADASLPASVALWRNLGGFPAGCPYRSIGVEPMLGSVFDLAEARHAADAVTVPGTGLVEWELEIASAA
jgi:hypothetical protein